MAEFYADRHIGRGITVGLRTFGHVVVTTEEMGNDRATDDIQLLTAAQNGWILLTHNRKDFELLHSAWRNWSRAWAIAPTHGGIVIPLQGWPPVREIAEIERLLGQVASFTDQLHVWSRDRAVLNWVRLLI